MFRYGPRKPKGKKVGNHNRPLGLILEWKMMMIVIYFRFHVKQFSLSAGNLKLTFHSPFKRPE
jgi:hypothetical protein